MTLKFSKITRAATRQLKANEKMMEHGITFERLENGDGRYTVNIMVDGRRIHRVIGKESEGTTRTQAEEFIEKVRLNAKEGRLNLPKGRKTAFSFEEAAKKYLQRLAQENGKDLAMKKTRLTLHIIPFFKNLPLHQITIPDIERYKKHRLDEKGSPGTINRELAILSHIFNKGLGWQWLDKKPHGIKRLKEDHGRIVYLTIEQINRLTTAAKSDPNPQIYPFIVIGLETAMRRMEILSIKLENIDLNRKMIYIPQAKAGTREQPITSNLASYLQQLLQSAKPNQIWLFPSQTSQRGHTTNIEKPFKRVVKSAELDPKQIVRHTLRHTAITHLVQAGVDLPTVKRISGHKTLQMVERYSHQNGQHIQAAMDRLEQRYNQLK